MSGAGVVQAAEIRTAFMLLITAENKNYKIRVSFKRIILAASLIKFLDLFKTVSVSICSISFKGIPVC
jgi:hypothetical protein